jgi:hypothetical protein
LAGGVPLFQTDAVPGAAAGMHPGFLMKRIILPDCTAVLPERKNSFHFLLLIQAQDDTII